MTNSVSNRKDRSEMNNRSVRSNRNNQGSNELSRSSDMHNRVRSNNASFSGSGKISEFNNKELCRNSACSNSRNLAGNARSNRYSSSRSCLDSGPGNSAKWNCNVVDHSVCRRHNARSLHASRRNGSASLSSDNSSMFRSTACVWINSNGWRSNARCNCNNNGVWRTFGFSSGIQSVCVNSR